jgi:regulator of Ty1 transposition protein 109
MQFPRLPSMSINLRDSLLKALSTHPGTREFHVHVLVSSPRKNNSLYPFAKPRPRVNLQDILILLSEQSNPEASRVIVSAIEANVYTIPSTSCAVFHVSKVDSTGQAADPSPTATLVRGLLKYYADPVTRPVQAEHLWIQLFARAQAQYLFPNSSEWEGKKWLSDIKLCAWWKRLLTRVVAELGHEGKTMKMSYLLPGYSDVEAENALRIASSSSSGPLTVPEMEWFYGHPYSQSDVPLPCPREKMKNLGHYIPYFDDDPKSRFLDEIAFITDGGESPRRKRPRTMVEGKEKEKVKDERPQGEMGKVTVDEFWERMSFRQECIAGAVTGFFTVVVSGVGVGGEARGQVSSQVNKRIMTSLLTGVEFSTKERSVKATDTLESAIKGLCEGDYSDIYGRVETRNAIVTVKSSVVAVRELNVRRRKR